MNCKTVVLSDLNSRYFGHPYRWIILNRIENLGIFGPDIQSIEALPDSNIILVSRINSSSYQLDQCKFCFCLLDIFIYILDQSLACEKNKCIIEN